MTRPAGRLGIVDWGIGGMGLLGLLDERVPDLDVVYWSDTGSVPYGLQATSDLAARLRALVGWLADAGCTEVALACNAASTVVERLATAPIPVRGIISAGVAAVPAEVDGLIGVVAGRRTVRSGGYRRGLARADRQVVSRVAQPLSAHIEAGRIDSPEFRADLHQIVAPLRGASAVVLACTHYPAAAAAFAAELPGTLLVDPARHLADEVAARWSTARGSGTRRIVTTGDPVLMRTSARGAWGIELSHIDRVAFA